MTTQEHESKEIQLAIANGWKDIHGGGSEGGAYWRGINPENKRVEKLPAEYTPLALWQREIMEQFVRSDNKVILIRSRRK